MEIIYNNYFTEEEKSQIENYNFEDLRPGMNYAVDCSFIGRTANVDIFVKEKQYTTYRIATQWLRNDFILCNNIAEIDESIWENARFTYEDENENPREIFQYFITDASESEVEYLEENFSLLFTYSDKLDCFVLCVDHLGTGWDYVSCPVSDDLVETWGDKILYSDSCNPPRFVCNRELIAGAAGK